MKRREFAASLGTVALALAAPARAQSTPVEGTQYVKLSQPVSTIAPPGKIEVIEFFWYGCPHCNAFEPALEAWVKKLPADVAFRRVPVAFREEPFVAHQRIYYALEALGQVEAMHRKVFYAIHNDKQRLASPADIQAFMVKNGIDGAKFMDAYNGFGVQAKTKQARQLSEGYKIDGVPALGIHGRFFTSGTLAGTAERSLEVANFLIERSRKNA